MTNRHSGVTRLLLTLAMTLATLGFGAPALISAAAAQGVACPTTAASPAAAGSPAAASAPASGTTAAAPSGAKLNIAFLPKQVNNPYFDTAAEGGKAAAAALGGQFKQVGPSEASASAQVPFINTLIQQHVSAIVISADDPNAVAPSLKQAMAQGIKVVSYDSDTATDARQVFVNQASSEAIGRIEVQMMGEEIGCQGEIAILSATTTATNQNAWIGFMKDELTKPAYQGMKLVKIAYGNDDPQTSLDQANGLIQAYPNLKGIIAPTSVGIVAAAKAIDDAHKQGKIALTGLGTPNDMREYVKNGTCQEFALWDVANLGYLAYYTAAELVAGDITGKAGQTYTAGKLGKYTIGQNGEVILGPPTIFTKENIDQYHF